MTDPDSIKKTPRYFALIHEGEVLYGTTQAFRLDGFFPATVHSKSCPQGQPWQISRADIDIFLLPHQFERCIQTFPHDANDIAAIMDAEMSQHIHQHPPKTTIDRIRELETLHGRFESLQPSGTALVGVINPGFGPPRTFPALPSLQHLVGQIITVRKEQGKFYINDNVLDKLHSQTSPQQSPAVPSTPPSSPQAAMPASPGRVQNEPCFA